MNMWKLISYSQVKVPLEPFLSTYIIGIVEDPEGNRSIVRIDNDEMDNIFIGMVGGIKKQIYPTGILNKFIPNLKVSHKNNLIKENKKLDNINKVGIVGTGTMGLQLAQLIAQHGFKVVLKTRSKKRLSTISNKLKKIFLSSMSGKDAKKVFSNIHLTNNFSDLANLDLIIDCIVENEKLKKLLFKKLNILCSKNTILATNTSSISISKIQSVVPNPNTVIGIHFFNPLIKIKLVEIIKGKDTSRLTVERSIQFVNKLDKSPLLIKDIPGFIVNRLLFSMINEAAYIFEDGIDVQKIDKAMKLGANHPMGPFELADFIGIDIVYEIIKNLNFSSSKFKAPAKVFKNMIQVGKLGRKTKEGFYKY